MYSLNAPVPPEVSRLAAGLARELPLADVRTRHSIVVKRLSSPRDDPVASGTPPRRAREALREIGAPAVEARVGRVECFQQPTSGDRPVAYLAVESPGIRMLHERLCETFPALEGLGGEAYIPHVTIARGEGVADLMGREVEPVTWTVDRLEIWDNDYRETVGAVSLPA
ncbi:MAG: 2'-5' RNA ligase family protein [Haloarculaceae archaeon]